MDLLLQGSIKNIQLADQEEGYIRLQYGKISDTTYALDFSTPFSPLSAFTVALTSFLVRNRPQFL